MTEKKIKVLNRAGVHARPAALVVQAVKNFKCNIFLERENEKINAKSIMGVITLGAAYGTELKIVAEGEDEQAAVDIVAHLFETKFEED
ncbi:phosphocarrier protein HPr [Spirochaetia bacterium]|nr:phosphocarrier protein HPr [Spirochaetia bacterium]